MRTFLVVALLVAGAGAEDIRGRALPPPAAVEGPLFERVETDLAALPDFTPKTDRELMLYTTGLVAGRACVGDFDGDGLPDIYLLRRDQGARLYRNRGGWKFDDVTAKAGVAAAGAWCTQAVFVDIDGDGDADLHVCVHGGADLMFVNRGDGTFRDEAKARGLAHEGATTAAAFGDFDRDGDLDVYLATHFTVGGPIDQQLEQVRRKLRLGVMHDPLLRDDTGRPIGVRPELREALKMLPGEEPRVAKAGECDRLLRNDGGTFVDITKTAGISDLDHGRDAIWFDYDEDGFPDIYVANEQFGADRLYKNNGDGTFTDSLKEQAGVMPWFSQCLALGDADGDARTDLFVGDMAALTHRRRLVVRGDRESHAWFLGESKPPQRMRSALFVGNGSGAWIEAAHLAGCAYTGWTNAARFGDLDNDGRADLVVANGGVRDFLHNDARRRVRDLSPAGVRKLLTDLPAAAERDLALRNRPGLLFEDSGAKWGFDAAGVSHDVRLADLDRDGNLDAIVVPFTGPPVLLRNRGNAHSRLLIRLRGMKGRPAVGARVRILTKDGVQVREMIAGRGDDVLHFGLRDAKVVRGVSVHWPNGRRRSYGNLKPDLYLEIDEPEQGIPSKLNFPLTRFKEAGKLTPALRHVETRAYDFDEQPLLPARLSRLGPGLACGDADGDGKTDIFLGGAAGQPGALALRRGDSFEIARAPFLLDAACEDLGALWFDADGDGDLDLYVVSGGTESVAGHKQLRDRLYRNDGRGRLKKDEKALPDLRDSGSAVVAADFDRDGDLDLFVGGRVVPGRFPETPASRLLRNDDGFFADVTKDAAPGLERAGLVTGALWTDVDGDGDLDLLVAREWNSIGLWKNTGGRFVDVTARSGLAAHRGWWHGLVAADVDADGDIDYIASNRGFNTPYRVGGRRSAVLLYADWEKTGRPRIVEAIAEGGLLVPRRGLSELGDAVPSLRARVRNEAAFAAATLEALLGADAIKGAVRLEVNEAASGVFRNDGRGRFTFSRLPRIAQVAPGFGLAARDFNGDGNVDICLLQNASSARDEDGPWTGGTGFLLTGDGRGGFEAWRPELSDFVVTGDGRALAVADFDGNGWPDLVAARSNDKPVVFLSREAERRRVLAVRLEGNKGNPHGIGARLTLTIGDRRWSAEMYAGDGYLSQSSPVVVFGLGDRIRPARLVVRWPDGTITETDRKLIGKITIAYPAK